MGKKKMQTTSTSMSESAGQMLTRLAPKFNLAYVLRTDQSFAQLDSFVPVDEVSISPPWGSAGNYNHFDTVMARMQQVQSNKEDKKALIAFFNARGQISWLTTYSGVSKCVTYDDSGMIRFYSPSSVARTNFNDVNKVVFYERTPLPKAFLQNLVAYNPHVTVDILPSLPNHVARAIKSGGADGQKPSDSAATSLQSKTIPSMAAVRADLIVSSASAVQGSDAWNGLETIQCLSVVLVDMNGVTKHEQVDAIVKKLITIFSKAKSDDSPHTLVLERCPSEQAATQILAAKPPRLARLVILKSKLTVLPLLQAASTCLTLEQLVLGEGDHTMSGAVLQLSKKCDHLEFTSGEEADQLCMSLPPPRFHSTLSPSKAPTDALKSGEGVKLNTIPVTVNGVFTFCLQKEAIERSALFSNMLLGHDGGKKKLKVHTKEDPLEPIVTELELVETKVWRLAFHFLENVLDNALHKELTERFADHGEEGSKSFFDFWNKDFENFFQMVMETRASSRKDKIQAASQLLGIGTYLDCISLKAFAAVALVIVAQGEEESANEVSAGSPTSTSTTGGW